MRFFAAVLACFAVSTAHGNTEHEVDRCIDAIVETARFLGAPTAVVEDEATSPRRKVETILRAAEATAQADHGLVVRNEGLLSYVVDDSSLYQLDPPGLETVRRHVRRVLERRERGETDVFYALSTADRALSSRWLRLFARERGDYATVIGENVASGLRHRYARRITQWLAGSFGFGVGWQLVPVFNVPVAIPAGVLSHLLFQAFGWDTAKNDLALILTTAGIGASGVAAAINLPLWHSGVLRRFTADEMFVDGKAEQRMATSALWNAPQLAVLQRHAMNGEPPPPIPKFLVAGIGDERMGGFGLSAVAVDGVLYVTFY